MKFVQTIEFTTSRIDEVNQALDELLAATDGGGATRGTMTQDRERPNTYLQIVEFPSYEEAMKNSELPETAAFAQQMAELCDGPAIFRNLDVVREETL